MKRLIIVCCVIAVALLLAASCGRSRNPATVDSGAFSSHEAQSAEQPAWLVDALDELNRLSCPQNADPLVFEKLKAELAALLREKAQSKLASFISATDTRVRDLRWTQASPTYDVFFEWGYVGGGDYEQDGVVGISDITPIAMNYGKQTKGYNVYYMSQSDDDTSRKLA